MIENYCPSRDADQHAMREDQQAAESWRRQSKPRDGLFSKFIVRRAKYAEVADGTSLLTTECVDGGTFVLRPFDSIGRVVDPAAIEALKAYANACGSVNLTDDIMQWLNDPQAFEWLNQDEPE